MADTSNPFDDDLQRNIDMEDPPADVETAAALDAEDLQTTTTASRRLTSSG